jgi:hypothetical protein
MAPASVVMSMERALLDAVKGVILYDAIVGQR